ncbi:hypothetical protein C723_2334 [Christiangramia flava JLT2011]|nr:hypothetical protein C723_2334 [Christiangramia flava JLT2011]
MENHFRQNYFAAGLYSFFINYHFGRMENHFTPKLILLAGLYSFLFYHHFGE